MVNQPKIDSVTEGVIQDRPAPSKKRAAAIFGVAGLIVGALAISNYVTKFIAVPTDLAPAPQPTRTIVSQPTTADPTVLSIPSLKLSGVAFESLGLAPDHTLEVPKDAAHVGWFTDGAKPGDIGPSVIVGHLDSVSGPAVFANLKKIKQNDLVTIGRADGSTVTYRVDSLSTYSQDNFPTQDVYGSLNYPGLRLITCSGKYNKQKHHYSDNLVVYATILKD